MLAIGQQHLHGDKSVILQKNPKLPCPEKIKTAYSKYLSYIHKHTQKLTHSGTGKNRGQKKLTDMIKKGGNEDADSKLYKLLNTH